MTGKRKRSGSMKEAEQENAQVKHQTLSAFHKTLYTFSTYLHLSLGHPLTYLVRDDDDEEYKLLLRTAIIAPGVKVITTPAISPPADIYHNQPEVIDRIINLLAVAPDATTDSEIKKPKWKRKNCLALGFNTYDRTRATNRDRPSVEHQALNSSVAELRRLEWKILHHRIGTKMFIELLVKNSIYLLAGPEKHACFVQLCGEPLCNVEPLKQVKAAPYVVKCQRAGGTRAGSITPINILLPRNKIFYAQTTLPTGILAFKRSLPRNHVLLGLTKAETDTFPTDHDCRVLLRHVFPKQIGMRNVLEKSSGVTVRRGDQASFDSGNRARELQLLNERVKNGNGSGAKMTIPKRLRGEILGLMRELIVRYREIRIERVAGRYLRLDRSVTAGFEFSTRTDEEYGDDEANTSFVPSQLPSQDISFEVPSVHLSQLPLKEDKPSCMALAVPHGQVHQFMVCVLRQLLPKGLLGSDANFAILCKHLQHFVCAKQHDAISLHEMVQGLRVVDCEWLVAGDREARVCLAESEKRWELLLELVYWIFDALVIPILKATFYITETAVTKYATVYFRRRVWDQMAQPHYEKLSSTLLTEVPEEQLEEARNGVLGVSNIRLVPKEKGFRPIANMGRRKKVLASSGLTTSTSANDELTGVYRVLTLHKRREQLHSTLFGTNEIFPRLQAFKKSIVQTDGKLPHLYLVKMDIKAAFDTIDQIKMLEVLREMFDNGHDYTVGSYAQMLPPSGAALKLDALKRFKQRARTTYDTALFRQHSGTPAAVMRNAVFVDLVRHELETGDGCMDLLENHIAANMVQIAGKVFRQSHGIPQGSRLSSMLCSLLYADLETTHLQWTNREGSLLLRYIDDYLFITTDLQQAHRFVHRMGKGFADYGAFIAPDKTLVSFEGASLGQFCHRDDAGTQWFPYCGLTINTASLAIRADHARIAGSSIGESFPLRMVKRRGQSFLGWFSRQLENRNHVAYLDVRHSGESAVRHNVVLNFLITGMKIPHYFRTWGILTSQQGLYIFDELISAVTYTYITGRSRVAQANGGVTRGGSISKATFTFLTLSALRRVLSHKAAKFGALLHLICAELSRKSYRGLQGEQQASVNKVWDLVKHSKY